MRDIVLLTAVLAAAGVAFRRPWVGLMTFVFLGLFSPQSYTWSFAREFPLSQVVAVTTIAGMVLSSERKSLSLQTEMVLLILLWVFFGISTLAALYPDDAMRRYVYVSKIFLMIIVATVVISSEERLYGLVRIVGYSLGFYGLKGGLFGIATGGGLMVYGPDISFLSANNSIGLALAMNIPILLYLWKTERKGWVRCTALSMLLFSYPAIICTYSRGAWLGMLAATILSVVKSQRKFLAVGLGGILLVFLQVVAPQIAPDRLVQRYDSLEHYEEDASAQSRFWNWEFCKRVGLARPLTGGGFDFYHFDTYRSYYPEFLQRWPGKVWTCHSTWLTIFGEHGFAGAIIWLSLLGTSLMSLRRIRLYARMHSEKAHLKVFVETLQASLVTYLVVGTFLDAAYFDLFYYLIAFVVIQKSLLVRAVSGEEEWRMGPDVAAVLNAPKANRVSALTIWRKLPV